jgi:uncharacterized protein YegP (UPF0339 family)
MKARTQIEYYQGAGGQWYWRCRHKNGHIVATGAEGYASKSNVKRAARRIGGTLLLAPLVEVEPKYGRGVTSNV